MKYVKNLVIGGVRHGGAVHYSWVADSPCCPCLRLHHPPRLQGKKGFSPKNFNLGLVVGTESQTHQPEHHY